MADIINNADENFVFAEWLELLQKYRDDMEKELETVRLHKRKCRISGRKFMTVMKTVISCAMINGL